MNALQPQHNEGYYDAFVVKIAPEGGAMIYGTYLGGSDSDNGNHIAVDTAGAAYVTGGTGTNSSDFPTVNALQPVFGGHGDGFVSKLSPDGASLVHSTYLGGRENDYSNDITVDVTGAMYVTGHTRSSDFPTVNALQSVIGGALCSYVDYDAFVVKITDDSLASMPAGASLPSSPTNENMSATSPRGGGGTMDALFVAVLAQFALAGALRRRSRPEQ